MGGVFAAGLGQNSVCSPISSITTRDCDECAPRFTTGRMPRLDRRRVRAVLMRLVPDALFRQVGRIAVPPARHRDVQSAPVGGTGVQDGVYTISGHSLRCVHTDCVSQMR